MRLLHNFSLPPRNLRVSALIIAALLAISGCGQDEPEQTDRPLRTVRHMTVSPESDTRIRSFNGVSRAAQQTNLSFQVAGTVSQVDVSVGQRVRAGDTIAALDPTSFELLLEQAQADRQRAEAERRNAAAHHERLEELYESRSVSRTELDSARTAAQSAAALAEASSKAVELTQLNLVHTVLVAQQSCLVADVAVDAGENVGIGHKVVELNCGDQLEIAVTVPETLIADISLGLAGEVTFDSLANRVFAGVVSEIGVVASGAAFPVTVLMDAADAARPGLAAQVEFSFQREDSVTFLPAASVAEDEKGRFVYKLVDGDEAGIGLIRRAPVEVGSLTSHGLEIISGVSSGDRVVTAGVSVIRDGMKVRIQ